MVKLINYNAIRTLTTPTMIKVYIILLIIGICYTIHYRHQMKGISIEQIKENNKNTGKNEGFTDTNNEDNEDNEDNDFKTGGNDDLKYELLSLKKEKESLEKKVKFYQKKDQFKLKKLSKEIKDNKKEIKKTFYESSRDDLENDSYLKEMGNLQKQFRDHENSKLVDYNQALSDTLEEKKKDRYNINLLNIGNRIENGLVSFTQDIGGGINGEKDYKDLIPKKENSNSNSNSNSNNNSNSNSNSNSNIKESFVSQSGNRRRKEIALISTYGNEALDDYFGVDGSVGLDKKYRGLEGFTNNNNNNNNKKNKNKNEPLDIVKDFLQYLFDTTKDVVSNLSGEMGNDLLNLLLKDENMISAGIILLIISVGLYFIDISS